MGNGKLVGNYIQAPLITFFVMLNNTSGCIEMYKSVKYSMSFSSYHVVSCQCSSVSLHCISETNYFEFREEGET